VTDREAPALAGPGRKHVPARATGGSGRLPTLDPARGDEVVSARGD